VADGQQRTRLLGDAELERSDIVANCLMNRERQLAGVNSYARELGFSPLTFLSSQLDGQQPPAAAAWVDLCCGSGRALIRAAVQLGEAGLAGDAVLVGVDLAGTFDPIPANRGGQRPAGFRVRGQLAA
jgi:hypothetical protein